MRIVSSKLMFAGLLLFSAAGLAAAQTGADSRFPGPEDSRREQPKSFQEMVAKQRLAKEKKDHAEMLKRGEEALALSEQLQRSFERHGALTSSDQARLEELEKLVNRIRKELGGSDDDDDEKSEVAVSDEPKPSSVKQAFGFLRDTTVQL